MRSKQIFELLSRRFLLLKSSFSSYLFNFCYIQDFLNLISVWDSFLVFLLHTDWQQQNQQQAREREDEM